MKWESDISHNWDILKNPFLFTKQKTELIPSYEDKKVNSKTNSNIKEFNELNEFKIINNPNYTFNFLRHLIIIIDLSENSIGVEFKPNKYKFIISKLKIFIKKYFNYNKASSMIIIGIRDSKPEIICPFFNKGCEDEIINILENKYLKENEDSHKYFPYGNFSLANSLLAIKELYFNNETHLDLCKQTLKLNLDVLLFNCSPVNYNVNNIFEICSFFSKYLSVNVITLCVPYDALKKLAKFTNGDFIQIFNANDLDKYLDYFIYKKIKIKNIKIVFSKQKEANNNINISNNNNYYKDKLLCICHNKLNNFCYVCPKCYECFCYLPFYCKRCQNLIINQTYLKLLELNSNISNIKCIKNEINFSDSNCVPYKLYKLYLDYQNNNEYISFGIETSKLLIKHKDEFYKETGYDDINKFDFRNALIGYKIKIFYLFLKFKNKRYYPNINKIIFKESFNEFINDNKILLLKGSLKCAGCEATIEIKDISEIKSIFIFSKCNDIYCENCYKYMLENDISCLECSK